MSRKDVFANWSELGSETSDFSTLWQPGTIHVLKVLETR